MSYTWIAVAVASAVTVGVATRQTLSKPMPSHVKSMAPGFSTEKPQNKAVIDKAVVFAMAAKSSGAFAGSVAWPSLAASANVPAGVSASSFPSGWTAKYSGATLTVCLLGAPNTAVDAITTKMSGVTAKNSGC
ncbi:hypothetical protein ABIC83_002600 [Roseateles asaccharophilus]|uniref:hypothetical protein n=1 Tax=Roseateles asaccharophilus TaxID=582607 RepID=UPI0038337B8A